MLVAVYAVRMRRLVLFALLFAPASLNAQTTVPFVGCPSDGQIGPLNPPHGKPKHVILSPPIVAKLAYYKAENGNGILAPLGWQCFSTYGSNGTTLFIAPEQLNSGMFFSEKPHEFTGPVIQLSEMSGGTSGRFSVALSIARLFPAHRDFAIRVRNERLGLDTPPRGPIPTDKLHYLSKETVEFLTPPNHAGEGTNSWLKESALPITGVVMITGSDTDCTTLAIRLPSGLADLSSVITHQIEQEVSTAH